MRSATIVRATKGTIFADRINIRSLSQYPVDCSDAPKVSGGPYDFAE